MKGLQRELSVSFVGVGNIENRRMDFFQQACIDNDFEPFCIGYKDLFGTSKENTSSSILEGNDKISVTEQNGNYKSILSHASSRLLDLLSKVVKKSKRDPQNQIIILRLESPGEDFLVEKSLIAEGASMMMNQTYFPNQHLVDDVDEQIVNSCASFISGNHAIKHLKNDHGILRFQRQWFLGYKSLLLHLYSQLCCSNTFVDIFDIIDPKFSNPCCNDHVKIQKNILSSDIHSLSMEGKLVSSKGAVETIQNTTTTATSTTITTSTTNTSMNTNLSTSKENFNEDSILVNDHRIKIHWMNHPLDIIIMFDKCHTHKLLAKYNIPTPRAFYGIKSYDELRLLMWKEDIKKVFVKIAHGSSASGVIAYEVRDHKYVEDYLMKLPRPQQPYQPTLFDEYCKTSAEIVRPTNCKDQNETSHTKGTQGVIKIYNNLMIKKYTKHRDVEDLINYLCKEKVIVEDWLPKAKQCGRTFDIRVVVINKKAQHFVVRTSDPSNPMTNLHLGNLRGDSEKLMEQINKSSNPQCWEQICKTCEKIATECFPRSLYMGIDVLISPGFEDHYVLEVNAFGDLIPRILFQGMDTYHSQVHEILKIYKDRVPLSI